MKTPGCSVRDDSPRDGDAPPARLAPSDAFLRACREASVPETDREALWDLHLSPRGSGGDDALLGELMREHGHWRLYVDSRRGDAEATRAFERFWRDLAVQTLSRRFPAQEVDELTAAFFARVYRLVTDEYSWKVPFTVYLRTVLLNLGRDHLTKLIRRREREASLDGESGAGAQAAARAEAPEPSPEQAVLDRERLDGLRRAAWGLPPTDRQILLELVVDGRPAAEVAEELGMSRNAVYQRLHRVRDRLRKQLEAEGLA